MAADQTVKEWQSVSVSVPVKATINDIIVLSDSDEEDVNIEVTSAGRKEVESPDINIFHCSVIYECRNQSANMAADQTVNDWQSVSVYVPVKSESEFDSSSSHLEFKVWKTGEREREAISLRDALKLSQDDPMPTLLEESNSDCQTLNPANCGLPQPSNIISDADVECRNQSANMAADQTVKEWQSVSVSVPVKATINDIIVLSDSDEEDVNIEVTSAGRKEVESPDINIFHCSSESEFDSSFSHLEFKVWKTGESEREEMSLRDALKLRQDDPMPTLLEESNSDCQTLNPGNCGLPQPSNIISDADVECRNQSGNMAADQTVKEWQSFSVSVPVKATIKDIIVLSDSDEEDVNIEVTSAGRKEVESPDINIWHCSGESEREAMSLRDALKLSQDDPMPTLLEESNSDCQTLNPANCGLPQPSNIISDADVECRNQSANMAADQTVNDLQSVSVYVPVKVTINDIIVLSDSDEEDVNIEVTSAGRKEVESPDINIWHCSGICVSGTRRPVSLSALKRWSESEFDSSFSHLEFKVWKTGESEREAMSLRDALKLRQDDPMPTLLEESNSDCQTLNPGNCGLPQPIKEWQSFSVSVPVKATINDIIVLSDSDEEDVNIEVTSAGRKEVESPDINIWHCSGESEREAMSLRDALKLSQDDPMPTLLEESNSDCQTLNPANCGLPQPSNIISDADVACRNQSANMAADQTVKEWQSVSVSVPVKATINDIIVLSDSDEEDVNIEVTSAGRNEVESPDINIFHCSTVKEWQSFSVSVPVKATINDIIVLSDSDEEDVNIEVTSAGRKEVESPDINIWHCSGESEREAMSLRDALKLRQDDPMPTLLEESNSDCQTLNPANCGLPQPSNIISDADVACRNQSANMAADQTVKEWQSVSVSVPVKATINDIIVLSDSDEEDVNIEVTSAGRNEVESPDINIFHCSVIYGSGTRTPVSLSALKR
ncbi:unnamed protein product [Trifolium pratense]|uniref:Uncharacterized protein n=1 Tax=Trifolium pratense TaxID=57577 RepID=A0ACB0KZZ4_TRIPR|nr:unnamed protein product [Trifolium pratense]